MKAVRNFDYEFQFHTVQVKGSQIALTDEQLKVSIPHGTSKSDAENDAERKKASFNSTRYK